jgi:hypothetical protein
MDRPTGGKQALSQAPDAATLHYAGLAYVARYAATEAGLLRSTDLCGRHLFDLQRKPKQPRRRSEPPVTRTASRTFARDRRRQA